jgi:hypothetical protein
MKQLNNRQKMFVKPQQSVQKFLLTAEQLRKREERRHRKKLRLTGEKGKRD